jgi:predicted HicB family RNase H-like nuclease
MIEYKGYVWTLEYDPEIDTFHGEVQNASAVLTFKGRSIDELKAELATTIDEYIAWCKERGKEAARPFRGEFLVRTGPELHQKVALAAAHEGKSLNTWVTDRLTAIVDMLINRVDLPTRTTVSKTNVRRSRSVVPQARAGRKAAKKSNRKVARKTTRTRKETH